MKKESVKTKATWGGDDDGKGGKTPTQNRECTTTIQFAETTTEAAEKFGEDVVINRFNAKARIDAQAEVRRLMIAGKTDEEITAEMKKWKPSLAAPRKDAFEALKAKVGKLTPEQRRALLAAG